MLVPVLAGSSALAEEHTGTLPVFQSDFGGVGLLQTPTARMAPVGDFSFNLARIDPYTNYGFSLQPFSWMEAGFRYTSIGNRQYQASDEDRATLDKGVRLKLKLLNESRLLPAVALGFRDLGGTGLFGSEYFVANKRWYDLDFSVGIGWGYLGSRGDIDNPLRVFGDRFEDRVGRTADGGGKFNFKQFFTGPANLFGGVQYQTPYKPLTLQLEYDGHDYDNEPLDNAQDQDSPINIGARLRVSDNLTLSAAWERGNTAMIGGTLSLNLATVNQPKSDPAPVVPKPTDDNATNDWKAVAAQLSSNAGVSATRISKKGSELVVEGVSTRYRATPEAELRANRILHNSVDGGIDTFRYRWKVRGMAMREDELPRDPLPQKPLLLEPSETFSDDDYRLGVESVAASRQRIDRDSEQTLYEAPKDRFSWNLGPELKQNYGGPDGYLYQILARASAEYRTDDHGWLSGKLTYTLLDNFDNYNYIADSKLPRVRTYIGNYLQETDLGLENLQYTRTARLSDNWFGMAYAGYLEQMYAGAGGELMYRPFNSPVALGFDANYVKQRDFDTRFGLRDYETWVGNVTAYVDTGFQDVRAAISVGRYLAGDLGTTLDFSRQFESGVRLGAYATFTDAGNDYGEGSFDKGIYISMPLDLFFTKSSRDYASVAWRPLTRDGGAKLQRRYTLYGITNERQLGRYWDNFVDEDE
ncbi:YjbH domain-containing protein [Salinisphaera aquimarina]